MSIIPFALWCLGLLAFSWGLKYLLVREALVLFPELNLFDAGKRRDAFVRATSNNRATTAWMLVLVAVILPIAFLIFGTLKKNSSEVSDYWHATMMFAIILGSSLFMIVVPPLMTRNSIRSNLRRQLEAQSGKTSPVS